MTSQPVRMPSPDEVLMTAGAAPTSAKWNIVGERVEGKVLYTRTFHVREYRQDGQPGALQYYPSGDPIYGLGVDIDTGQRGPEDDGTRRIYIQSARMIASVREAVRRTGASGIEVGAWLSIVWTGTEQASGSIPAKTWAAEYRRPNQAPVTVPDAGLGAFSGTMAHAPNPYGQGGYAAPQAPAAHVQTPAAAQALGRYMQPSPPQPAPAPVATGGQGVITESLAAAMRNAGVDVSAYTIVPG